MGTDLAVTFRATIGRDAQAVEATSPSAQFWASMLAALHPALYVIRQTGLEPDDAARIVNFLLGHVMAGIEFQRERTQ